MSQELVQLTGNPNAGIIAYSAGQDVDETGLNDVSRLKPSTIILCQNTTRDMKTARAGQLLDTLTEEVYDSLTVVPLKVMRGRVLFPAGSDLDAEPLCRSNDGITPSPFANAPQSSRCATCPKSQWINGQKAECAEKLKLLVVIKESGLPRIMTFGGKSITTLRNVLQRIQEAIRMAKAKGGDPLHLYDYFFTVRSEKVVGKYSYYVARFDDVKRVANVGDFGALFEEFVIQRKYQQAEEDAVISEARADQAVNSVVDAEFVPEAV